MNLQQLIGSRFTVNVDGRASKRDVSIPGSIVVESTYRLGSRASQIDQMVRGDVVPVAFIDADAQIWQLTAGGSGLVMFESADNSPLTDDQMEASLLVERVLSEYFGLVQDEVPVVKPVSKKRAKKPKEPDVLLGTVYPEDDPDEVGKLIDEVFYESGDN